ncbi:cyclic-phosphate processing receiver domain-containing protein [Pseudomonas aeruginosa]
MDDERSTPEGWVRTFWPDETIELLKRGSVTELSLDHDLGDDDRGTGYTVLLWLEEQVALNGFVPPAIRDRGLRQRPAVRDSTSQHNTAIQAR